jgi:hypothetical protein
MLPVSSRTRACIEYIYSKERKARIDSQDGQTEQDSKNRITGMNKQIRTGRIRLSGKDCQERTSRTELAGQDSHDKTKQPR